MALKVSQWEIWGCKRNKTCGYRSPSGEASTYPASQEIPHLSWNVKVHYCIHKNLAMIPILSQMLPVHHTFPPYLH